MAFCDRFIDKRSRTHDQMVQAARSVARASLDELLLDYEDFLRGKRFHLWEKDDNNARRIRAMRSDHYDGYRSLIEKEPGEIAANTVICLIHQANYLLDRQIAALERQFIQEGGYTERLAAERRKARSNRTDRTDRTDRMDRTELNRPACPKCGQPMAIRTARQGQNAGSIFWGCVQFPECKGTRDCQESEVI